MSSNLQHDLSVLTTIPEGSINKLSDKIIDVVCQNVFESITDGEQITKIDTTLGCFYIRVSDDKIEYKFVPSNQLENEVQKTVQSKKSPLIERTEDALISKIMNVYKELI